VNDGDSTTGCGFTVLRCRGNAFATKRWTWNAHLGQWAKTSYGAGREFIPIEHHVASLREMSDLLETLRKDPKAFIVRGALSPAATAIVKDSADARRTPLIRRLKKARDGHPATLVDVSRLWLPIDIDQFKLRPSDSLVDDPEAAIEHAIHELLPPCFHDADYYWQLSASAGFVPGVLKVHVWFWLSEPATNRHLKAIFKQHAPRVDTALFDSIQVHFIADPLVEGRPDPIPRRTGWRTGFERSVELPALAHPTCQPRPAGTASSAGSSTDIMEALAHLGYAEDGSGDGFHEPLRTATMRYAVQCDKTGQRDDEAVKDLIWNAVQAAPCHDGRDLNAGYRDGPYLQNLIDGAFRLIESNPQHPSQRPKQLTAAQEIAAATVPLKGTPGEHYLEYTCGISPRFGGWPDSIRYLPDQRSIVAIAHGEDGSVQAVQVVRLAVDGARIGDIETTGVIAGAAARLPGADEGPLLLTQSIEVGLAAWSSTHYEVWIVFGALEAVKTPAGRHVVILADDHPPRHAAGAGVPAARLNKAVAAFRAAKVRVAIAKPWAQRRRDSSSFVDLIIANGTDAVAERIQGSVAPSMPTSKRCLVHQAQKAVASHTQAVAAELNEISALLMAGEVTEASERGAFVKAIGVDVGTGKSSTARSDVAKLLTDMRARGDTRVIVFAVPDHALGEQQRKAWTDLIWEHDFDLRVEVWRGRTAPDPRHADYTDNRIPKAAKSKMCVELDRTIDAESVGLPVQKAVCEKKMKDTDSGEKIFVKCPSFETCPFQANRQRVKRADIIIVPHSSLTHAKPDAISEVAALIVDEASWLSGLIGIENDGGEDGEGDKHLTMSLNALLDQDTGAIPDEDCEKFLQLRLALFDLLTEQPIGPLARADMLNETSKITADTAAEEFEFEHSRRMNTLHPGQTREQREEALQEIQGNKTIGRMAMIWDAVRVLLSPNGPERSGWLAIAMERIADANMPVVRIKKRKEIAKGWCAPTLILDATLNAELVRPYWPNVEVMADVRVATPHQRIFQVIDRAYSQTMLKPLDAKAAKSKPEEAQRRRNRLHDLRATIYRIARIYTHGEVLVILQLAVKDALLDLGPLPPNVVTAHHNSVAGRDEWKHVAAEIIVGRTQPKPSAVERIAEALTGRAVENPIPDGEWYLRVDAVREMADGTSLLDETDRHPDPLCEAVRWQIAEGQIVQAVGRTRGVWRTADNPCDVWVLTDLVLPLPLDGVVHAEWLKPTVEDKMIAVSGGGVFSNAEDAFAACKGLWDTANAARVALSRLSRMQNRTRQSQTPIEYLIGERDCLVRKCIRESRADYQLAGERQTPAVMWFDPWLVPDVEAFLTKRLESRGALAWVHVNGAPPVKAATIEGVASVDMASLPEPLVLMIEATGVVLTNPADVTYRYRALWPSKPGAKSAFQRAGLNATFDFKRKLGAGFRQVNYLRAGRGARPAVAWFDPVRCEDIKGFLAYNPVPLMWVDIVDEPQPDPDPPEMPAPIPAQPDPDSPPASAEAAPVDLVDAPASQAVLRPVVRTRYDDVGCRNTGIRQARCRRLAAHKLAPRNAHCPEPGGQVYILNDAGPPPPAILALRE